MELFNWITLLSLVTGFFSFMCMASYLYKRSLIKHRLWGIRPDIIVLEYCKTTRKEKGHFGILIWILIYSFVVLLISLFIGSALSFYGK
jgi:hypothetical protein